MLEVKQINSKIALGVLEIDQFSNSFANKHFRAIEKAGSLYVLKKLLENDDIEVLYSQEGKPFLKNRPEHISISHSHAKLVVCINKTENTGVDIELIRDKVQLIQHKFLNEDEKIKANNDVEKLIIYWAAKETLYKLHGLKGLDFIKNISIQNFGETEIIGKITNKQIEKTFLLGWEKVDNYILAYSLNEI
jgi:phosphopantetheinyl transferase